MTTSDWILENLSPTIGMSITDMKNQITDDGLEFRRGRLMENLFQLRKQGMVRAEKTNSVWFINKDGRNPHHYMEKFVTELLPDFCWVTVVDVYKMLLEQGHKPSLGQIHIALNKFTQDGVIEKKLDYNPLNAGQNKFVYRRNRSDH